MIPLKLSIEGFLSYRERVEVDFSGIELACISGANGAGKSSLLDAFTWVIFGQSRGQDSDAVIHSGAQSALVLLEFEYETVRYRVQRSRARGKTTQLEFQSWSPDLGWRGLSEATVLKTNKRITETLNLDYDTFINASFFLQGKADQFATQKAGDRKKILSSILGLEKWERYRELAAEKRKAVESEIQIIDGQLKEIDEILAREKEHLEKSAKLQQELALLTELRESKQALLDLNRARKSTLEGKRKTVLKLKDELDSAQKRADINSDRLSDLYDEIKQYRLRLEEADTIRAANAAWKAARQRLEEWDKKAVNFRVQDQRLKDLRIEIDTEQARLETEVRGLRDREADALRKPDVLPELQKKLARVTEDIQQIESRLASRVELEELRDRLIHEIADADAQNKALKKEMDELNERITRLESTQDENCPICGQPLPLEVRVEEIRILKEKGKSMGDTYRANVSRKKEREEQKSQIIRQLDNLRKDDIELRKNREEYIRLDGEVRSIEERINEWQTRWKPELEEKERILRENDYAHSARAALASVAAELKQVGYDFAAHETCRQEELNGRKSADDLLALEKAESALEPLQRQADELNQQADQLEIEIARRNAEYEQAEREFRQENVDIPDLDQLEDELRAKQIEVNKKNTELGGVNQEIKTVNDKKARKGAFLESRGVKKQESVHYKSLEKAFGKDGIPALLIEQALPEIEAEANKILERLSGGTMAVRFETQQDYKDKKRDDKKETLDIIISDASGPRPYELYSGGEAFRVNFAIRLALSRVLAQRSGARLQTLVIDEGFGSQDAEGRQRLIEAINMVRGDFERILVITHLEELKDAFPARIEVEKTPAGSRVKVIPA